MYEELLRKAVKQAKANVELETTPIKDEFIENYIDNRIKEYIRQKRIVKRGSSNGNK